MNQVLLDGKYVSPEEIDPGKHRTVGNFRPPSPDNCLLGTNGDCPACEQRFFKSGLSITHWQRTHWRKGCFDVPQYVTIEMPKERSVVCVDLPEDGSYIEIPHGFVTKRITKSDVRKLQAALGMGMLLGDEIALADSLISHMICRMPWEPGFKAPPPKEVGKPSRLRIPAKEVRKGRPKGTHRTRRKRPRLARRQRPRPYRAAPRLESRGLRRMKPAPNTGI